MNVEQFGDADASDLVFVLGWGNRIDHENVRWLIDRLAERYRAHVFEIPISPTDFEADYLDPVAEYVADLESFRFLGHSTGGLIGARLRDPAPKTRTYLSPWWGYPDEQAGLALNLVAKLPTSKQFVPTGTSTRESLGELATDRQLEETPGKAAPSFLRVGKEAHAALSSMPFEEDAVVFYTPGDDVVSPEAIERRVPERNRIPYDGGHELFSSNVREDLLDDVLAAVDGGIESVEARRRDGE